MDKTTNKSDLQAEVLGPGQPSLLERAAEIDRKHGRVAKTMRCALLRWIALGHELNAAKKQVREELGPRQWHRWLKENTDLSERTAQEAMSFARHESELRERLEQENRNVADLSIRQARQIVRLVKQGNDASGNGADSEGHDGDGDADQPHGEGANGADKDADGSDSNDSDDDGDQGGGDEDEDDSDAREFEALRLAYEDADEVVREAFHEHLKEVYGLEVRPATKGSEQPDGEPAAAA